MSNEQHATIQPDVRDPDAARQAELRAAYQGDSGTPYKDVQIRTLGEVQWIIRERQWSGEIYRLNRVNLSGANLGGVNLRGVHFYGANLSGANLVKVDLSDVHLDGANLSGTNLYDANLHGANFYDGNLQGANLDNADLSGAELGKATLSGASLHWVNLSGASLNRTNLSSANLDAANLSGASLHEANFSGANLYRANLSGADMREAEMDTKTTLHQVILDTHTRLGDVRWNGAPLLRIDWEQMLVNRRRLANGQMHLGDEDTISQPIRENDKERSKTRRERLQALRDAARAYRGLGRELKDQNLPLEASWCRLRERRLERRALFLRKRPSSFLWGIGSWLLDLVSGYGELPTRTFLAYLLVVGFFAILDFLVTNIAQVGTSVARLSWDESLVLSLTSFHGRGFFPGYLQLNDWVARIGAVEAVIGLFIELILIATFSRRFLGD